MLKTGINKVIAVLLSGLILLAGNGYALNKMVCSKSGKLQVSFAAIEDCCSKQPLKTHAFHSKCCTISSIFFRTSTSISLKNVQVDTAFDLPNNNFSGQYSLKHFSLTNSFSQHVSEFRPPPIGLLHCLLLI